MTALKLAGLPSAILILAGLFVPSRTIVSSLRTPSPELADQLLLGATLFRIGLVILGLSLITVAGLFFRQPSAIMQRHVVDSHRGLILSLLLAILLVASALRLYGLGSGLWYDEILTYVSYARMPFADIVTTYDSQNQHFLYTLLAHASLQIFGQSAWALRLPAAIFGVASIWALYLLGRQLAGAPEALAAAAMLAVSFHHIWFSQNARGYTGLLFWTLVITWLFLRGLRDARPLLWLSYAIAASLGVYTHMTMVFVIGVHFTIYVALLILRPVQVSPNWQTGLVLGFGFTILLTLQLHALVLPQIIAGIAGEESTVAAWKHPLWALREFSAALNLSFPGASLTIAALLLVGAGLASFARTHFVVIPLFLAPAVLLAAVVVTLGHHVWPRFFFFSMGFGALVVVRGAMVVGAMMASTLRIAAGRRPAIGVALCAAMIVLATPSIPVAYAPKQDYIGALAFVEGHRQPGDSVVTVGLASFPYRTLYKTEWAEVTSLDSLNSIRARAPRTWLVYTLPLHVEAVYPDIMTAVRREFKIVKEFYGTLAGGTIFVCRSDALPSISRR